MNINLNYINIITSIIEMMKKDINFDTETVVFTGHSLGGFLATILGMKYNKQVFSFDSPGTRHYINLLNLQGNTEQIYHFSHTADSIAHGHCGSACWTWGYYLDTECHVGNTCVYDSKKKLGYFDGIRYHQLKWIIDYILPHWETDPPECVFNKECKERNCEKWEYV
jgi:lipase ATG15